jgi:drug/metabolite transporter (DMT)-like permease
MDADKLTMNLTRNTLLAGVSMAMVGSIAFSAKAVIVKLAYRYGVDAVTLIMYRMLFALPLFAMMAWWASRGKAPLSREDRLGVIGLGLCGYYLSSYLDFLGLQYISASLERLILYLNPTMVLILGALLFKRRISRTQAIAMALSYGGVLLVLGHELSFESKNVLLGTSLVFASALTYALYLVYSAEMVKRLGSLRLVGLATSVACVFCMVQFLVLKPVSAALVAPEVIWLSVLNATLCTAVPVVLVMMAMERIGASLAAQTSMIGPMSTIAMGVLVLGESFNAWILGGTVLVLLGVYWASRSKL